LALDTNGSSRGEDLGLDRFFVERVDSLPRGGKLNQLSGHKT
jgi:hypothetical protein